MTKPGVKINLLPVWFLAGSVGNSVVNLESNKELSEIWKLGLSREENDWGGRGAPESQRPQFLTPPFAFLCKFNQEKGSS